MRGEGGGKEEREKRQTRKICEYLSWIEPLLSGVHLFILTKLKNRAWHPNLQPIIALNEYEKEWQEGDEAFQDE